MISLLERGMDREEVEHRIRSAILRWRKIIDMGMGRRMGDAKGRPFMELLPQSVRVRIDRVRMMVNSIKAGVKEVGTDFEISIPYLVGVKYGEKLVELGLVRSLDDLAYALAIAGVGLVDVVVEKLDKMLIRIFECASCYGHENVGKTLCYFEMGVLRTVLKHLYRENSVIEKKCWGLGHSFCEFCVLYH